MSDPQVPFGNYQYEIYLEGLAGKLLDLPTSYAGLEAKARERLSDEAFGYVAGGAGEEITVRSNREAFDRWRIVPRMLVDVRERDLRTTVLGTEMPAPVMLAPIGVTSIVHDDAERAVARAARELGLTMILSNAASTTMEDVAQELGDSPRWFQLYWPTNNELAASFVQRAQDAGYSAIVVTLDTRILAWRPRDLARGYLPFLKGEGVANYFQDPVFRAGLDKPPEDDPQAAVGLWATLFSNPGLSWDDLAFLQAHTDLPILLKGVLHPDDARRAVEAGVDGLIVSNHGGRQIDGSLAALEALPEVVEAVPDELPVLFDSGIRTGADVVKALALGARAVLVGRPYVWGLGLGGEHGVRQVLRSLLADFDLTLALCGYTKPSDLGQHALRRSEAL
ncbi:MAG TPA: lactate 2-monooxygenase [Thermoleophilaceae bacterium]|jgi:isopentenyl diphosphate isomerase/L-lactate dehydrogenase-like FMN-dependent dehydrogenase